MTYIFLRKKKGGRSSYRSPFFRSEGQIIWSELGIFPKGPTDLAENGAASP